MKNDSIPLIPDIPEEIIQAIETGSLVLFVGAGVSSIAGLPQWSTLANELLKSCCQNGYISAEELDLLFLKLKDSKEKISIASEIFEQNNARKKFYSIFYDALTAKKEPIDENAKKIFNFCKKCNALVLTTNADLLLDKYYEPDLIYNKVDNEVFEKYKAALVKIHGSINEEDTLVFTTIQYLKRYSDDVFKDFLKTAFSTNRTVLFIGYGLSEFELLEYTIGTSTNNSNHSDLFVLNPYYSYEEKVKEYKDLYYESMNIKQIAYCKDEKSYDQLADVLEAWLNRIEIETSLNEIRLLQIESLLLRGDVEKECQNLLQLVSESKNAENYLFSRLRQIGNAVDWLGSIIDSYLFSVDRFLPEQERKNEEGEKTYFCPIWNSLLFVSYLINNSEYESIEEKIHRFIISVVEDVIQNKEKISNYKNIEIVSEIIVSFNDNILKDRFCKYLDCISNYDTTVNLPLDFYRVALSKNSHVFSWESQEQKIVVEKLLIFLISIPFKSKADYILSRNIYNNIDKICSFMDKKSIQKLILSIKSNEKQDPFLYATVGSIEKYNYTNEYQKISDLILYICKKTLEYNYYESYKDIFANVYDNDSKTINKLKIFMVSSHYQEYKSIIFNSKDNPFDHFETYSDLYFLIQKNIDKMSLEECEVFYQWVKNVNFGEREFSDRYKKWLINNIYELLSKKNPKYKYMDSKAFDDILSHLPQINDINKQFVFHRFQSSSFDDIIELLENMSVEEIVAYLSTVEPSFEHSEYDYYDAFVAVLKSKEEYIYTDFDKYTRIPKQFYRAFVSATEELKNYDRQDDTLKLYNNLINYTEDKHDRDVLIHEIFFALKKFVEENQNEKERLLSYYEFVMGVIKEFEIVFFNSDELLDNDDWISLVHNNWFVQGIRLILLCSIWLAQSKKNQSIQYIDYLINQYSDNEPYELLCSCLAYNVRPLLLIDKEWFFHHLDNIFVSDNSVKCFLYNSYWSSEIYDYLYKSNKLSSILFGESEEEMLRRGVAQVSVQAYIESNIDNISLLEQLAVSNNYEILFGFIEGINLCIKKEKCFDKTYELLIEFSRLIQRVPIDKGVDYDQLIRGLVEIVNILETVGDEIWDALIYLAKGFDGFFSDELCEMCKKHFGAYSEEVTELVLSMLSNTESFFLISKERINEILILIKNNRNLKTKFNEINNILINNGIYLF